MILAVTGPSVAGDAGPLTRSRPRRAPQRRLRAASTATRAGRDRSSISRRGRLSIDGACQAMRRGRERAPADLNPASPPPTTTPRAFAAELRLRLVERRRAEAAAGEPGAELEPAVRELVDEAAAILSAARREQLVDLILRDTVGLGPLEELLADDEVEEVMVNGHDAVYVERRGRIERERGRLRLRAGAARRDRAHPRPGRPPGRRAQPDGRRAARRRLAGQRRHPAARRRRPGALGAPLLRPAPGPRGAGRARARSPPSSATCSPRRSRRGAACSSPAAPGRARRRC